MNKNENTLILVDTHAHIDSSEFAYDRDEVLRRALAYGVRFIIVPGIDLESSRRAVELAEKYWNVFCSVGVHPNNVSGLESGWIDAIEKLSCHPKVVAIGEIGLDFYRDFSPKDRQEKCFRLLVRLAKSSGLPMIIHIRDAHKQAMEILEEVGHFRGALHAFSGDEGFLKWALRKGLCIGFGGPVTFPNFRNLGIVRTVPMDRLLLETDAPYLTPHPYRGRRNEPAMVKLVCEGIAQLRDEPVEQVAKATTTNACRLFRLPFPKFTRSRRLLGQNYLQNTGICQRIVSYTTGGSVCLEIGSGKGELTRFLASRFGKVYSLEIDYENARRTSEVAENVIVVPRDILTVDLGRFSRFLGEKLVVAGNIPYSITTQILFYLAGHRDAFSRAVIMVQKEFAQRLCSLPGEPEYGIPTAVLGNLFSIRRLFDVAPANFNPPPKVWSTVLEIVPRGRLLCEDVPPEVFAEVCRAIMSHRRKTILNSLRKELPGLPWGEILLGLMIDTGIRGEKLDFNCLCSLAREYYRKTKKIAGEGFEPSTSGL